MNSKTSTQSKTPMSFMVYLAGLSMLGYLAIDMYLPAFGMMQRELSISEGAISNSLSIFLFGFAVAQLLWGPLSDKVGRKPILLIGLSLFSLGCLGMLWVESATGLLAMRFLQAFGVCSAAVIWQALVIDRFDESRAQHVFALIMPLVALSPALAPLIGASLLNHGGWRMIFMLLMAVTLVLMLPTLMLKNIKQKSITDANQSSASFITLLKSPLYTGNVLVYASCSAGFFAWLAGSPIILEKMGYSPQDIGLSYIPQTIAFMVGGYGCRILLSKMTGKTLLPLLLIGYAVSMTALYLVAKFTEPTLTTILIPFCIMAAMNGASYPIAVSNALSAYPEISGKAAALQNALQLGLCSLASFIVSAFISQQPLINTTAIMALTAIPMAVGYFIQRNKSVTKHTVQTAE
ncbi:Bcr/CflA family multidrug efflux MFS transporter [Proteus cibarius]|uniref:Bcr/CflA family efflux transporter n=1 Tax=Proteus terrae subsp. cibarius TaxID=626774 RepID=A0A6I6FTN1_9GAMM|nr:MULTISPECIES: purine nucleoside transporter PunC [Proteus]QHP76321.1 Bcr/CflA family multidrug efflux MFS transporter [Proteus vulgaris]MBG2912975.1 Bcr/CflA family multidrug efflux MFS transporter [Proteus terrae subsp. cibarius]MBG3091420.1 Bcr/CflA family multidrug efflux MFS transporter [Proteus terrae subsp. cibarius]MBG6038135.1 Bcr/CflA family multidrug efflux MFS transporter [Proteus terrae subsp. cibarius]MCM2365954.1 purine nucleoside transporter PunC [Proteus sp. FZP2095]